MGLKILATGKAVPKNIVTNQQLCSFLDTSDEWITSRTGIKSRYITKMCIRDSYCCGNA